MKQFNDDNFVLETKLAQDLYHKHAAHLPIIDYHCHLPVREIAEKKMPDLNAASIEAAMRMVAGTARSMGITVEE